MKKAELLGKICLFLNEANKHCYASAKPDMQAKEADNSTTISWVADFDGSWAGWEYEDNYFGGEPFAGNIKVTSPDGKVVWMMLYHGSIADGVFPEDESEIVPFLKASLRRAPQEFPCRGPEHYKQGSLEYRNNWFGDLERFHGSEVIRGFKDPLFHCNYVGGLVDQRPS